MSVRRRKTYFMPGGGDLPADYGVFYLFTCMYYAKQCSYYYSQCYGLYEG